MILSRIFSLRRGPRIPILKSCFTTYTPGGDGPNHAIIEVLKRHRLEEDESPMRNPYKVRAFSNAIKVIGLLDHPLQTSAEALSLKGIGHGVIKRIAEHLDKSVNATSGDGSVGEWAKQDTAITELQRIPRIGAAKARQLVKAGCFTATDLALPIYQSKLSAAQKIGYKYREHLVQPVLRQEAETVRAFIQDNISSKFEVILCGSYRRGADTLSEISILLFHPSFVHVPVPTTPPPYSGLKTNMCNRLFPRAHLSVAARLASPLYTDIIPPLEERGFLADTIVTGVRSWEGIVRLPERNAEGKWGERRERLADINKCLGSYKRVILHLAPTKSRGAALLALTGDLKFHRDVRLRALSLGMHLDQSGLWKWNSDTLMGESQAMNMQRGFWELVRATTEEEILSELGMEYIEPEKRNFEFLSLKKRYRQ